MPRPPALLVALVLASVLASVAGCGGGGAEQPGPRAVPAPAGLAAYLDQSRVERVGREAFVRLVDEDGSDLTVLRAVVGSDRIPRTTWRGETAVGREEDLEVELPRGRCGSGSDAEVELTYRRGDAPTTYVSRLPATDRYGAVAALLDRDCALGTLLDAASVDVGEARTRGRGRAAVLEVPVLLTPTGRRDDVVLAGLEDTVLFRQVAGSASVAAGTDLRLAGPPVRLVLRVVPSRCDPHALAEDKVGTLFPMDVVAPGVPARAGAYLPLDAATRAALRRFVPVHCDW